LPPLPDPPPWLAAIYAGRPASIYLIVGDPFLTRPLHRQILEALLPAENRDLNWEQVDGEKEEVPTLIERLRTYPLFPGPKVVSVKNFWLLAPPEDRKGLLEKAREAWEKGEAGRSKRLLARILSESGVSLKPRNGPGAEHWKAQCLKVLEELHAGAAPDWVTKVLETWDRDPSPETSGPEELLAQALQEGLPEGHFLILINEQVGRQKKIVRHIEKNGVFLDQTVKSGTKKDLAASLKNYLKPLLAREGKSLAPQAEALLLQRIGPEPGLLAMEIGKLAAYAGDRGRITVEDVDLLIGVSREEPLYELTTALGEKNPTAALRILQRLWERGFHPLAILTGITNAFRRFLAAREWLDALPPRAASSWKDYPSFAQQLLPRIQKSPLPGSLSKLQPFALFNLLKSARLFSSSESVQALEALQRIDRRLKTTGADGKPLLEDFILTRCR
jgi:DNA polymerase III delta subunit